MPKIKSDRTPEQIEAFKRTLKETNGNMYKSKLAAGYSENVARQGRTGLPKDLVVAMADAMGKDFDMMVELGKRVTPEKMKHAVLGSIARGIATGSDAGAQMTKLGGSWKEVDLYKADSVAGVVVIESPRALPQADNLPVLDAEIVETPKQLKE